MESKDVNFETSKDRVASQTAAARLIAFYLPQFHPTPENDLWWGKGFTEWTNVAKARALFRGHYQPHIPADLGFYDLRLPEVRAAQAAMAREAGLEGFCYWHYWFAGRRMLERPFNEVLRSGEPNFPFCLGWANQTWSGAWHGAPNKILIEQTYPGRDDSERHFHAVLEAFHDPRYIRVRGKPVFLIFVPHELPRVAEFIDLWQELALRNGLPGVHFVAHVPYNIQPYDFRAAGFAGGLVADTLGVLCLTAWQRSLTYYRAGNRSNSRLDEALRSPLVLARAIWLWGQSGVRRLLSQPRVYDYAEAMLHSLTHATSDPASYPCVLPNWDHSPRTGRRAVILKNSTPELFRRHLHEALRLVADRPVEDRLVFVKSWNEWAEGNYLEPDQRFGHDYLNVVREEVFGRETRKNENAPHVLESHR